MTDAVSSAFPTHKKKFIWTRKTEERDENREVGGPRVHWQQVTAFFAVYCCGIHSVLTTYFENNARAGRGREYRCNPNRHRSAVAAVRPLPSTFPRSTSGGLRIGVQSCTVSQYDRVIRLSAA